LAGTTKNVLKTIRRVENFSGNGYGVFREGTERAGSPVLVGGGGSPSSRWRVLLEQPMRRKTKKSDLSKGGANFHYRTKKPLKKLQRDEKHLRREKRENIGPFFGVTNLGKPKRKSDPEVESGERKPYHVEEEHLKGAL